MSVKLGMTGGQIRELVYRTGMTTRRFAVFCGITHAMLFRWFDKGVRDLTSDGIRWRITNNFSSRILEGLDEI